MPFTFRQRLLPSLKKTAGFASRHKRGFVVAALIGVLLAFVGALGTDILPLPQRVLYWEILMLSGAMIGLGVSEAVDKWERLQSRPWVKIPLIALLIAVPLTFVVIGTGSIFFQTPPPSIETSLIMFAITGVICLAMTTINFLIHPPSAAASPATLTVDHSAPVAESAANSRFAERLPSGFGEKQLIALEAEDHYLRVHFADGSSTMILMRLSDAISELPDNTGARTHRSWWVARDAVQGASRNDGRATLTLTAGIKAQVSRSYYKHLVEKGWFG